MVWTVKKCHVITERSNELTLTLANESVGMGSGAEYLGISLILSGIGIGRSLQKVEVSQKHILQMERSFRAKGLKMKMRHLSMGHMLQGGHYVEPWPSRFRR